MATKDDISRVLAEAGDKCGISALEARLPGVGRRTLQRWRAELVMTGEVERSGRGPRTVYRLRRASEGSQAQGASGAAATSGPADAVLPAKAGPAPGSAAGDPFDGIPLAPDAAEVLMLVSRPLAARTPVGYQRAWLEEYVPGKSALLSPIALRRLEAIGDTGQLDRPAGTWGREILQRLLIDLSWASSHLEGNTYTRLDTRELIEQGTAARGRAVEETQMILNHKAAIEYLVEHADDLQWTARTVREMHALLSENLLADPMDEGRLRTRAVDISGSVFRPLDDPWQVAECLDLVVERASGIPNALEQSFFLLVHLPYLQPFVDVNKRTSRLMANLPLLQRNLCPLTFVDVPPAAYALAMLGVYELTRTELLRDLLLWAYDRSSRDHGILRRTAAPPDPLRLQYRDLLRTLVRSIIQAPHRDLHDVAAPLLASQAEPEDREPLLDMVHDELRRLHEGTLARYGLRLSEWEAWLRTTRG